MAIGKKQLLKLFELVQTHQLEPPAALDIALSKTPFPGEPEAVTKTRAEESMEAPVEASIKPTEAMPIETPADQPTTAVAVTSEAAPERSSKIVVMDPTNFDQHLSLECTRIAALSKVERVMVYRDFVHVLTTTVYCTDPRDNVVHEIGKFRIELSLFGNHIYWHNLDRWIHGRQAPHVNHSGFGILGNMQDVLPPLLARGEFSAAADLAIAFVESANVDDPWGKNISDWPVAQPQPQPVSTTTIEELGLSADELASVMQQLNSKGYTS